MYHLSCFNIAPERPHRKGNEKTAMWFVLAGALLLVAFGSKAIGLLIRLVLVAVHKVGLLSNIRLDVRSTLQLSIQAVHLHFWRNVWRFVQSPTQQPLVTIDVATVHAVVALCGDQTLPNEHQTTHRTEGVDWSSLDTSKCLRQLDHPVWWRVRTWMHRVPFACFIPPMVSLSVSDIQVDVVHEDPSETTSIVRLQKGSAAVHLSFNVQQGEMNVSVRICEHEGATISIAHGAVEATLRDLRVAVAIPVSRAISDARAPIPTFVRVECEEVGCAIDLGLLVRPDRSHSPRDYPPNRLADISEITQTTENVQSLFGKAARSSRGLLLIRLVETVPDISVKICNIHGTARSGVNKIGAKIEALECTIANPSKTIGIIRQSTQHHRDVAQDRKLVFGIENLVVSSEQTAPSDSRSSALSIDVLHAEIHTKLAMGISSVDFSRQSTTDNISVIWTSRCTSEVRGLTVGLAVDLAPWVEFFSSFASHDQAPTMGADETEDDESNMNGSIWNDFVAIEMQVQLKLQRTEVLCQARDERCVILPNGVPDIGLFVEEVVFFAHPFADEETLGVRAKFDLQGSRLKMFYAQSSRLMRSSFLSIDFVRVLIEPISVIGSDLAPADVEMEAEWLEVRWTPEAMHAIGGMLDLGIVAFAPLMREEYDWTSDEYWDPSAEDSVQSMKPMDIVVSDIISPSEAIKFRCKVKRSLVLFSHTHEDKSHLDYVSVDTLNMSVEETTGRFRLSVLDTKVCNLENISGEGLTPQEPLVQHQNRAVRRRRLTLPLKATPPREKQTTKSKRGAGAGVDGSPFFCVKVFALEENRLPLCPMKVLDMFVEDVSCLWDMKTQERIVELIRQITYSSWEMLYRMRSTYGVFCTSPASRFNRHGGVNGDFSNESECDDRERLLSKIISAGGDTLNRIHAMSVSFKASFGTEERLPYDLSLHVGVFASDDLPELWRFEGIEISLDESLKLLEVDRVLVRHTLDRRRDYVFGFFEEVLRLRKIACGRIAKEDSRKDGIIIDIDGLRVGLSLQVDLVMIANAIRAHISPFLTSHMRSFQSPWRPQEDLFYRFFHRMPQTPGQPMVWLQLADIHIECFDKPMEAWLEHVYPLWMEELAEQELRSQLLEEQVSALKLTNADMLTSNEATDELTHLLREKSSKIYVHKVRRLEDSLRMSKRLDPLHAGSIISVRIGCVAVDVSSEPDVQTVNDLIRELDEATPSVDQVLQSVGLDPHEYLPQYALLIHQELDVCVTDISVRIRKFPTPVVAIEQVKVCGHTIVAATKSCLPHRDSRALTAAARCFVDLDVAVRRPVVFFGPAYVHAMLELAVIVERALPSLMFDVDRAHETAPWDIARRVVHGRLHLDVEHTAVRLLASSTTFQVGDYLEVGIQRIDVLCARGKAAATDVTIDRLTVKIEPDALVNIAELTSLTLNTKASWTATRDASIHYILPIEYRRRQSHEVVIVNLQDGRVCGTEAKDLARALSGYSGQSLAISVSGKIAPKTPAEQMTRRDIASRSAIVLYTKHVEWLIHFVRVYTPLASVKLPRRSRVLVPPSLTQSAIASSLMIDRFLNVFKGVVIDEFSFIGLDLALYHSERSQVGLRACINDKIVLSGALHSSKVENAQEMSSRKQFVRRVSLEWNGYMFVIDDVSVAVNDVQVRVCTPSTGSRGETLVSIRDVCLNVGGGSRGSQQKTASFDFATLHAELLGISTTSIEEGSRNSRFSSFKFLSTEELKSAQVAEAANEISRTKSKINILDHFAIAQHNPYRYRDDNEDRNGSETRGSIKPPSNDARGRIDSRSKIQSTFVDDFRRQGFLLGLSASEIHILVTLDTVETLVDIGENWMRVIRASVPELYRIPEEILKPSKGFDTNATHAGAGVDSPKKATSLADDPKFGPIFHASNPIPNYRVPSFNVDSPTDNIQSAPTPSFPDNNDGVVEPFLIVRFLDCQINIQDNQNKGSVLLALSRGTIRYSRSQDVNHELVDLKVDGVQLFTAPLDVDVRSRIIWLRTLEDGFTYCPSSYGLLKQVVAPIPAKVSIWIDRRITVTNKVDLCIPTVQISVNIDSKIILENLALALVNVITIKLAEYQAPDYSKMLQGYRGLQSHVNIQSSLHQLLDAKKGLKWRIADLQWRQACRWNYRVAERASLAMQAMEGLRGHGSMDTDTVSSPFLNAHRLSSASLASSIGTSLTLDGSMATHVESPTDELQRLQQQHDSIGEVLRSLVAAELLKCQPSPNVQLMFTLQSASLTLSATNSDIVSAAMTNLTVKLKMFEDQSGTFALTIQDVCCKNLCPNTPYPELLIPLNNSKSWSGDEMFVRIDAEVAPPVGGIKIVRHFEINVHPMQVCITYDLIFQLVAFFTSVSSPSLRQEEKKAEVRSQFLAAPQQSGSSSGEGLLKRAVKVAGKATHPLTHGLGRHRADSDQDHSADPRVKAMQALQEEATQWISRVARTEAAKSNADSEEPFRATDKDVNEMRERANNNILFKRIRLGTVEVMVSFKNKKNASSTSAATPQALEDMRGFEVKIHSLVYSDKTCSLMDLLLRIRRDVILDVLSQVGRNFTNVANFLRDQLDITRWGAFDALAPLKSLSTAMTGTSQNSLSAPPSPANPPSTPGGLSVELLQRSPRVSRDPPSTATPTTPVDVSKVFQLELPDNHPSRRKKQTIQSRPSEPVGKVGDPIAVPVSPLASPRSDKDDAEPTTGAPPAGKAKKTLSSLFGKSRKQPPTASIGETNDATS